MDIRELNSVEDWNKLNNQSWFFSENVLKTPERYPCTAVFSITRTRKGFKPSPYLSQWKDELYVREGFDPNPTLIQWIEIVYIYPKTQKEPLWKRIIMFFSSSDSPAS